MSQYNCVFSWGERNYPGYFNPAASTEMYGPYYYRYYSGTGNYLVISTADNHVYVLGSSFGSGLLDVGSVASFLDIAGCR